MIQRKQSIWLLLAALLNAGVLLFDFYTWHQVAGDAAKSVRVGDNYASLLVALVMAFIPLVAIFLFRNRKLQIRLSLLTILVDVAFLALMHWRVSSLSALVPPPVTGSYWVGAVLPVAAIVFLFLAVAGIRKDDKLVKSVDRLR